MVNNADPLYGCGYACIEVCPVDAIHPKKGETGWDKAKQVYIDPDTCIDCGACEPECPVQAIFTQDDTPEQYKQYIGINADYYKDHQKKKP